LLASLQHVEASWLYAFDVPRPWRAEIFYWD
jgi:hypothetical protein